MPAENFSSSQIVVRHPLFAFGESVPNHYMGNDLILTHLSNVFHASIPAGERFIIKIVAQTVEDLGAEAGRNPEVEAFLGQEKAHADAHDLFTKVLEAHGYHPERVARAHDRLYKWVDRLIPSSICLAIAAGIEHYTADLGHSLLEHPEAFDGVQPKIAKLLTWHAAEEVEHRSVVFDVLQLKSTSYFLRVLGFILASILLAVSTLVSFIDFVKQDRDFSWSRLVSDFRKGLGKIPMFRSVFRLTINYLRPGFHPSQGGDIRLAQNYLDQLKPLEIMIEGYKTS